ncbi:TPA: hypothetical protein HA265_03535, partial [Candidatus Woesearchaeota archaeon]|nr:hypothetical protein [Candidatus Woesearchaeota archaeon]
DAVKWAEGQYDRRAARKELAAMQARGEITQAQYEKFENDPRSFLKNRGEAELALATGEITKTEYTKIMSNPAELDAWIAKRPQIPTADRNLIEDAAEKGHITETQYREFLRDLTKRTAWLNTYKDNFKKESLEQVKGLDDAKQKGLITDAQYREMINDPTKRKSWYEGTWKKQEEEFKKWEEAGVKPDLSKALTQITPPKDDKTKAGQTAEVEGNTWIFDSAGKATVCLSCEREYPPNAVPPVMGKPTEGDVLTGADGKSQWYYHDKEWRYVATTEKEQRMSPFNKEELADFKKDWTDEDKARGWREVESGDRGYDKKTPEKWAYNEEGKPMFCYKNCLDASEGPTSAKEPPAGLDPTKLKVGQEQTSSGLTWRWDGTTWVCTDAKCPVKKDAYDPKKVKEIMDKSRKEYETWEPVIKEAKRYGGLDKKQFDELVKDRKLEDLKTITNFGKKVETIGLKPQEVATYCDTKTAQCTKAELGINTDPAKGGEIIYKATVAGKEVTPWSGFYCPSCIQETKDKSGDTAGKVCANAKTGGCTEAEMFAEGQVVFKGTEENPYVSEGWKPYTIEGSKEKTEYQTIQACRDAAGTKDKGKCKGGPEGYKQVHYYWSPGTITDFLQGGPATNIMRGFGTLFPKWQDPFGWGSKLDTYFNLETILISRPCLAAHGQEGKVGISPAASGIPTVTIQAVKTKVQPCEGLSGAPKAACMEENGLTGSRSYYWQYRITGKVVPKDCDMEFNIQLDGTNMYNTNRELDQGEAPFDLTGANAIVTSNEDIPNNADKICVVFSEALHGCIFSNAPSNKKEICNTIFEVEDLEQELEGDESTGFYQAGSTEATVVSTAAGCSLC